MSKKINNIKKNSYQYTKKAYHGGGSTMYKVTVENADDMINFLKYNTKVENLNHKKNGVVNKVKVPRSNRDEFTKKAKEDGLTATSTDRMGCVKSCDFDVTIPSGKQENILTTEYYTNNIKLTIVATFSEVEIELSDEQSTYLKYYAKKNKLKVTDSNGKSVPEMSYDDFNKMDKKLRPDPFRFKDAKYDETRFNKLYEELIEKNPNKVGQSNTQSSGKDLKLLLPKPRDQRQKEKMFYILNSIDIFFNEIDAATNAKNIADNIEEKSDVGVGVVEKTRALTTNFLKGTYRLLKRITPFIETPKFKNTVPEEVFDSVNIPAAAKTEVDADTKKRLKEVFVSSVFEDIYLQLDEFANQTTDEGITFGLTEQKADTNGWFVGLLPLPILSPLFYYIRGLFVGYGRGTDQLQFSKDEEAREMLRQRRKDAENGIKNEFSLLSALKGTEGQKTAAKVAVITGAAAFAWAIVGKIQQNPELAAMVTGAVMSTGIGGAVVAGTLIACGVAYYAILKIKEKYSTYYLINRTLNELTILLHRIQKLVRLAVLVSHTYNFDIIIGEINEELKIIFSRFDEFLKADDYNGIQGMINANATPDLDMAAVTGKAAVEAKIEIKQADKQAEKDGIFKRFRNSVSSKWKAFKAASARFVYTMTLDEKLWNEKLNKDIVRLNIYLTASIGEFNLVLNVMQMSYISKGLQQDTAAITSFKAKQTHIEKSSEYMRMLIGILLNDILKLRVDISYCSRGNSKAEKICLDYQDTDGAGNIVTVYRRHLHFAMITLVEKMNDPTSVYGQHAELCEKVRQEVVTPYIGMLTNLRDNANTAIVVPDEIIKAQEDAFLSYFEFLSFRLERPSITKNKQDLSDKVNAKKKDFIDNINKELQKLGLPTVTKEESATKNEEVSHSEINVEVAKGEGGGVKRGGQGQGYAPLTDAKDAKNGNDVQNELNNRMDKTTEYIISEPYVTIPDEQLSQFLTLVYNFSKKESKTTEAETKEAIEAAIKNSTLSQNLDAITVQTELSKSLDDAAEEGKGEQGKDDSSKGGRRLTRKRILNLKKNHHHHRRVSRTRAPFKSAAAALAAFRRG